MESNDDKLKRIIGANNFNNFTKLAEALKSMERSANRFTVSEFQEYEILFSSKYADTLKTDDGSIDANHISPDISKLSNQFVMKIDLYSPIVIVESDAPDAPVLLTLPPILSQVANIDYKFTNNVDANYNQQQQDIPKYREGAFFNMINSLMQSQLLPEQLANIKRRQALFKELSDAFYQKHSDVTDTANEPVQTSANVFDGFIEDD